jgi:hypothetical protein
MTTKNIPDGITLNELVEESFVLMEQIKELTKRRSEIAQEVKNFMVDYGQDRYSTEAGRTVSILPAITPSFSYLSRKQKDLMIDWLYHNDRSMLTVVHTRLPQLVVERKDELPVEFTSDGFSVRLFANLTRTEPKPLEDIKIKQYRKPRPTPVIPTILIDDKPLNGLEYEIYKQPLNGDEMVKTWSMSKEEIMADRVRKHREESNKEVDKIVKEYTEKRATTETPRTHRGLTRQERIERKAEIIKRYMNGDKKTYIARDYGLSDSYVGELLKKHERQLLKEMISNNKPNKPKDDQPPMFSTKL